MRQFRTTAAPGFSAIAADRTLLLSVTVGDLVDVLADEAEAEAPEAARIISRDGAPVIGRAFHDLGGISREQLEATQREMVYWLINQDWVRGAINVHLSHVLADTVSASEVAPHEDTSAAGVDG